MKPETAADWIAALRSAAPTMSLAALEVLLRVAAGADNRRAIQEQMPNVDRTTIIRSLQLLRGDSRWASGRWIDSPVQLLKARPHPHIAGASCYSLSQNGKQLVQFLQSD